MTQINAFGKPLLALVIIILIFGIIFGAILSNYNPAKNAAEARRMDVETDDIEKRYQLEREARERELADAAEHKKALMDEELGAVQRRNQLIEDLLATLSHELSASMVPLSWAGSACMLILSIAIAYAIVRQSPMPSQKLRQNIQIQNNKVPQDLWVSPETRKLARELARDREREALKRQSTIPFYQPPTTGGTGPSAPQRRWSDLPLAEYDIDP